jgi:adenylyl/guanylyl cyclase-like protein with sensor domain/cyclic GMP-AMP synthase DncV-like protein
MFNVHPLLMKHYADNIRLGADRRHLLAQHRDSNLERLKAGLAKLAEEHRGTCPVFLRAFDQGGYAMHTLNQHPDNEYDIDTGVVFSADSLPTTALAARQLVADALCATGGAFSKEPEARTNAVTVWYAEGHHVDLAIYREKKGFFGDAQLEHAGADWTSSKPREIPEWFIAENARRSPSKNQCASVDPDQFRRVVRYVKAFAKSRANWSMPGGMIISALVAECYRPDLHCDDVALVETMRVILRRLSNSTDVRSPVGQFLLTSKPEYIGQVGRLKTRLEEILPKMDILFQPHCSLEDARRAWHWIFRHDFWLTTATKATGSGDAGIAIPQLRLAVGVASGRGGKPTWTYRTIGPRLPKGVWLRFKPEGIATADSDEFHWKVENSGDEAAANNDLRHEKTTRAGEHWERTLYKGDHKMICELRRRGQVLARGERTIRIGAA